MDTTNPPTRLLGKVPSEPVLGLPPGRTDRQLTAAVTSVDGKRWPAGSVFVPLCGGYDNDRLSEYSDVTFTRTGPHK